MYALPHTLLHGYWGPTLILGLYACVAKYFTDQAVALAPKGLLTFFFKLQSRGFCLDSSHSLLVHISIMFLLIFVPMCAFMHARAEDNSQESCLFFDHVSSGDQI